MNKLSAGKYPLLPVTVLPCGAWTQGAAAEEEGWLDGVSRVHGRVCTGQPSIRLLVARGQVSSLSTMVAAEPSLLSAVCRHRVWSSPSPETPRALCQVCLRLRRASATGAFVTVLGKLFKTQACHSSIAPKQL